MKKVVSCLLVALALSALLLSCKKDHTGKTDTRVIYVTLSANDDYTFDLGNFGDEEGASVSRQALHYQVSSVTKEDYSHVIYKYKPVVDYIGTDEVELKSERGWDRDTLYNDILFTTIKFTIAAR